MLDFLMMIFGEDIEVSPYIFSEKIPYYIRDNYIGYHLTWMQNECILIEPCSSNWRLPVIKKQLSNFQKLCSQPCALSLRNLTALQRRNLVEAKIPFVSMSQQVYLPFWGCAFIEKFKAETVLEEKMAPATQLVFLFFYYNKENKKLNLTTLSRKLHISKATCTRAIEDLTASNLVQTQIEGTNKWLIPTCEKEEFLKKGYSRLKSPVDRIVYVDKLPDEKLSLSGIKALSEITTISSDSHDGGLAIYKKESSKISSETKVTKEDFEDFGGSIIEVWSYDPTLFSSQERVDDISLLLSLEKESDERIQMGLDKIRNKHGIPKIENE